MVATLPPAWVWRAWADETAELTLACVAHHAAQIEGNALHW